MALLWPARRRAAIVLPSGLLDDQNKEDQAILLAHELAHVCRRDHWVRWFETLVLAAFWWHPIAWLASRRLRQAEEQCCDTWVMWAFPREAKRYAHALLRTVRVFLLEHVKAPDASRAITSVFADKDLTVGADIPQAAEMCRTDAREESLRLGEKPPFRRAPPQLWIVSFETDFDVLRHFEF